MAASKKDNVNAGRVEYLGDDREGKLAALNNAVAAIEKNYGKDKSPAIPGPFKVPASSLVGSSIGWFS